MKVLVVSTSFPISRESTSGIFVKRLVDALSRKLDVQVVVPDGRQRTEPGADYCVKSFRYAPKVFQTLSHEPGGLPVAIKENPASALMLPSYFLFFFLAIWRYSRGVDLIHANWSLPGVFAGIVGLIKRIPVVTTLRGDDVSNLRSSWVRRSVLSLLLRSNARLITVSPSMAQELSSMFPLSSASFQHIPNGVDENFLSVNSLQEGEIVPRLLCVGSLIKRKRIDTAIEALARVPKRATLTIVGEGPEKKTLVSKVAALGLTERVEFVGEVPPSQIANTLSQHDALILCSCSEGRPNVVLEAMASARVVIATDLPGIVDFIEDSRTGLLFPVGDVETLSANIEKLMKNPCLSAELGNSARTQILNQGLTWETCAARYYQVYEATLKGVRCEG